MALGWVLLGGHCCAQRTWACAAPPHLGPLQGSPAPVLHAVSCHFCGGMGADWFQGLQRHFGPAQARLGGLGELLEAVHHAAFAGIWIS